jgi:hypothetical protein
MVSLVLAVLLSAAQMGLGTAGEPPADFHGRVRSSTSSRLLIDAAGEQTLEFHCSRKTKFYDGDKKLKAFSLKPGDRVSVEAQRGLDGALNAVNVRLERSGSHDTGR